MHPLQSDDRAGCLGWQVVYSWPQMQGDELRTLRSAGELDALANEWDELAARCPGYFFSQTCRWASAAWRHVGEPRGRTLYCLTLRAQGRLVAVWPLVVERSGKLRVVRPLGTEGGEYSAPLIEDGPELRARTKLLWSAAAKLGDLVVLPNVRADAPLAEMLPSAGLWRAPDLAAPAPFVARRDYADWAAYQQTLNISLRRKMRRVRRRLAEKGRYRFAAEDPATSAALIDWILGQKKHWLDREGLQSDWIGHSDYRDFLAAVASRSDTGLRLFALRLDGVPIAAKLATVDPTRFESHIGVYDPKWSFYSPGQIMTEDCLAWAFERGLDFDLRVGEEPYKRDWAPRSCDVVTWYVATGWRGLPVVARRRAVLWSWQLRSLLRRLLGRRRAS
jgi:CelD/BcsL family acetyltransferase involved in cellulose biosynthesis